MAIAQVGGASNQSAAATTLTVTYSPTNGNIVVLFFVTSAGIGSLVVKDNNNVVLNAGPTQSTLNCWYYTATGSPTSFTATWTNSVQVSMAVEEYSGATAVDSNFSLFHNSGNSATATISITLLQGNNWIVCGFGAANTITATTGNQRQQTTTTTARITLIDNTAGTPISVTCAGSLTSTNWSAVGVILGGVGEAVAVQEVALAVKQPTSTQAVVPQDVALVVVEQTNSQVHVSQILALVLVSNNTLRQLQVRKPIIVWRKKSKKHAIQIPLGMSMHAAGRRIGPKSSTIT